MILVLGKKLFGVLALAGAGACLAAVDLPGEPLTHAASVLSLSGEQAGRRLKVTVTGVVTAAEPDWNGQFFVQDDTAGVFVENIGRPSPAAGDLIALEGVTHPGAFAPIISAPAWHKLGTAPLPEPKQAPIEDLMTGVEDGQRVEVSGVVRAARVEHARLLLDLVVVGNRLQVHARVPAGVAPDSLIAARVRVRGTAATHYIGALRHMTAVALYVPRLDDFIIVEPERTHPFDEEVTPINSVAQYRRGRRAEQRVHVGGVVTLLGTGGEIFLQDGSGGIRVDGAEAGKFAPGDLIEAAGFIEYEGHLPLLRDAVVRPAPGAKLAVAPRTVPFREIASGQHHGELITLRGRLLDRSARPATRPDGGAGEVVTTWLVQGTETTFTIEQPGAAGGAGAAAAPLGSLIEADGVCVSTVDAVGKFTSLRLLLPPAARLRVLERPSWLTPARLLAGLGVVSAVLVVALAWLRTVAKKNAALHRVVHELELAQRELQEAHDTLEEKVAERSAQLQVEMTARKASELQFKAVLTERTRLARDLHDTLEQTLAGIALRLKTAAKLAARDPGASDEHLQLARNWLHQSQVDLRRSIWDLRSRELEQFDLARALRASAEQLVHGTDIALDFQATGSPQGLPEVVEENVLRIGQEALTNIAKHAGAKRITIRLDFSPRLLRLRLEDDGAGFDQTQTPAGGHFGLTGMAERAKRLAGSLVIASAPGRGTALTVEIPVESASAGAPPRTEPGATSEALS
jgi:signal transduction histidine kinase